MATLTIRNFDAAVKERLRVRAARHGRSMEAEARTILSEAAAAESDESAEPGRGHPPALCAARRRRSRAAAVRVCRRTAVVRSVIVVDTNVISELMRGEPDSAVPAWVAARPRTLLYTTYVNQAEILYGPPSS